MKLSMSERAKLLAEAYEKLIESDGFLELLRLRTHAGLSRFSLGNICFLYAQAMMKERPLPQQLATYKGWQALGRYVKPGSKHDWDVLQPYHRSWIDDDGEKHSVLSGFGLLAEFGIDQTDGKELPEEPPLLASADHEQVYKRITAWCLAMQVNVITTNTGSAHGWYDPAKKEIALKKEHALDERLCTLIHECIHLQGIDYTDFRRDEAEMITEAAAAIVVMGLGIEHLENSLHYIGSWAKTEPTRAIELLDRAEKAARKLEETILKED